MRQKIISRHRRFSNLPVVAVTLGRQITNSVPDINAWEQAIDACVLTRTLRYQHRAVLVALLRLVLQEHGEATHGAIVGAVARLRGTGGSCSVSTVQRALRRGQALGLLDWVQQYDVTARRDLRRFVPSQVANNYTFHLPESVGQPHEVRKRLETLIKRRPHSRDRPGNSRDGQTAWVDSSAQYNPLGKPIAPTRAAHTAAHQAAIDARLAAESRERAERVARHIAAVRRRDDYW